MTGTVGSGIDLNCLSVTAFLEVALWKSDREHLSNVINFFKTEQIESLDLFCYISTENMEKRAGMTFRETLEVARWLDVVRGQRAPCQQMK